MTEKKPVKKKKKAENIDKIPDRLTALELRFLRHRVKEGLTLAEAYKKTAKSKSSLDICRREGWRVMRSIKLKLGAWSEVFELYDLGPDRIMNVYEQALGATVTVDGMKTGVADHRTRVYAAKNLQDIHGLNEETINIVTDEPLPLVVVIEEAKKGKADDNT